MQNGCFAIVDICWVGKAQPGPHPTRDAKELRQIRKCLRTIEVFW